MIEAGRDHLQVEDSAGDGPPVVLLHPGIADMRVWDPVWPALIETHRVIRYDMRGYGGSSQPTEPYDWVSDLLRVLDHAGLDSAHLVGNSMGGATALAAALDAPKRVRSLVLLAPGISGYPWPEEPELSERWVALAEAGDRPGLVELMLEVWCAAGREPFVRDLVTAAAGADAGEQAYWRELEPAWDRLGELTIPTVLMVGDLDPASMVEAATAAAARIPSARLIRIPDVDHLPQVRVPDLVVTTIRQHCID
ncbi:MAG: alpha/beta fold hydrolase [Kineosporiaceae bacterium]|jgi:pimeloyl-ACP methyl ester carboxylesterase|nr:alpha/beta fold hydrolase [Kineosporiaceae bacterium]MBK7622014.1 alpha/beta fold hydrolase [Kineosporiaceae bacterium]MBK8074326.1 alpha/beta fold hydrolase [Kineosporiaceae bacterium]